MTIVDQATRCFLSWRVVTARSGAIAQEMVYKSPAERYFSDRFQMYFNLHYGIGAYLVMQDKSETYAVEAGKSSSFYDSHSYWYKIQVITSQFHLPESTTNSS